MTRKELKKTGHRNFHRHYLVLIFLCLIVSLFGTEGAASVQIFDINFGADAETNANAIFTSDDVYSSITAGDLSLGEEIAGQIESTLPENLGGMQALGTRNGVLADVVNSIISGRFLLRIAGVIYAVTKSEMLTGIIFILLDLLLFIFLWIFLRSVFSVILRRMMLEGRAYEKLPFSNTLHIASLRKWFRAALSVFVKDVFEMLWTLTIVGGIIKHYSYYLVPFIIAENPGIKGREAVTLSRKMMKGHKWEAFVLDISFILWYLLSAVTIGLSDLFYGFAYRTSVRTEYYVRLRGLAKENAVEGAEALNDVYLYEKADKITLYEKYFDVVDMQTLVLENKVEVNAFQKFMLNWLGVWLGSLNKKRQYDEAEGWKYNIKKNIRSRDALAYPLRLNGYWKERKKIKVPFSFIRSYSIWTLLLLFMIFCMIGWTWEVCLHMAQTGEFVNRGLLHGPWLPIYGAGGLIALMLCSRFRQKPVVEFFVATTLCGVIEYFTAVMLEERYNERWWSYDGCFLNIHGRVCAEGLIVFGIACMLVVYFIAPLFDFFLSRIPAKVLRAVAITLFAVFLADMIYSSSHPNIVPGAVETKTESSLLMERNNTGTAGILKEAFRL